MLTIALYSELTTDKFRSLNWQGGTGFVAPNAGVDRERNANQIELRVSYSEPNVERPLSDAGAKARHTGRTQEAFTTVLCIRFRDFTLPVQIFRIGSVVVEPH